MDCLQLKLGVTDCIFQQHKAPLKDIDVIPIKDVFMGPLKGIHHKNGKWEFPQYLNVKKVFEKIKNVETDSIYNTYTVKGIHKIQKKFLMICSIRLFLLSQAKMRCIKFKEILCIRISLLLMQRN